MCPLDELLDSLLSVDSVKKYVDDYSIYTHYIGKELELGRVYSSPLRTSDKHPSFSIFETKSGDIIFKDHGTGLKGNVFKFLRYILSENKNSLIPFKDVLNQINLDFDLGLEGTPKTFKPRAKILAYIPKKERPKIETTSKKYSKEFLTYFDGRYGISKKTLQTYNVFDVRYVKYVYSYGTKIFTPQTLCISYRIGKYHKIYMPFNFKEDRFRTDFLPNYVEGFLQLQYKKPFVIITKAMKEVMFLREHFNVDSIAGKSENTMIPDFLMQKLFRYYKYVLIWLDRDQGGVKATEAYLSKYPELIPVNYTEYINDKDITDRYFTLKSLNREKEALQEILLIIKEHTDEKN